MKTVGQGSFFSRFRECSLQRIQSVQEGSTEEEGMKQQQRLEVMKDTTRKSGAKGRMDADNSWRVSEFFGRGLRESLAP